MASNECRVETDSLGKVEVPVDALYGAQTQRAAENFPVSGLRLPRRVIRALALVKKAAAEVNRGSGKLDGKLADAIIQAAHEVAAGQHDRDFLVDIFQTGSGTSSNMNANEVIANRAIQILGGTVGSKKPVHPNDHVNMGQSSNDVFPTAMHIAAAEAIERDLLPALRGAAGRAGREGEGVRRRRQDRPHAPDGRGADPPGAGVLRLRADPDQHRAPRARRVAVGVGAGAGRHRGRHRAELGARFRAQDHPHHQPRRSASRCARRPTSSRRCRRATGWSRRRARCGRPPSA